MMSGFSTIGQTIHFEDRTDNNIILRPVVTRPKLSDLLAQVTPENLPDDADVSWSELQGSET